VAAGGEGANGDAVAGGPIGDACADGGDGAGAFVADDLGEGDAVVHIPVEEVEVGATDAAVGDLDLDLSGGGGNGDAGGDGNLSVT
jgi:hypothetical protein